MKKLVFALIPIFFAVCTSAAVIYVNAEGAGDYPTIQAAINAAVNGDHVVLMPGVYKGDGNYEIQYNGKAITVRSTDANDWAVVESTIIDCQGWGTGFIFQAGEDTNSVLAGITITNGAGKLQSTDVRLGGAIYCDNSSSPSIERCLISNNQATAGGGIYCHSSSNPSIKSCLISDNLAEDGGGIFSYRINITNTIFLKNLAVGFGVSSSGKGGAINARRGTMTNCTLFCNYASREGGAIYRDYTPSPLYITNSIVYRNWNKAESSNENTAIAGEPEITYSLIEDGWPGEGNIDTDPMLTWSGHLRAGSPCIDAGTDVNVPNIDFDGETRPIGSEIDIGADEFADSDADGLPDWWELRYTGDSQAAEPDENWDNDDWTNLEEYWYATKPNTMPENYYVDGINGSDSYDGLAMVWDGIHGPKKTIQAAINLCEDKQNDTVTIVPGIYTATGRVHFYGKAVTVRSINPDDPCVVSETIIDCQGMKKTSPFDLSFFNLIYFESSASAIDGLTIKNANLPAVGCNFANLTLRNCNLLNNNNTTQGGAVYCDRGSMNIINCNFLNNSAGQYQSNIPEEETYYGGGAIFCRKSILNISDSSFSGNSSERYGAAISAVYSNIMFKNCSIVRNEGSPLISMVSLGPAIGQYYSTLSFENSDISGNIDGAIFGQGGGLTLKNCILTGNGVPNPNHGSNMFTWAGVIITNGIVDIDGCTFSGNRSYRASAILVVGNLKLSNSIFWENESIYQPPIIVGGGETEIKFCRIEDGQINISLRGTGNIDVDPCFVNPGYWDPNGTPADANDDFWVSGDYRLKSEGWRWDSDKNEWSWDNVTSRCIDAGNPGSPLGDEPLTLEVDPLNRWGQNLRINMGAYGGTAQASMAPYDWALLSDIDNNGTVDFADFARLSGLWLGQDEELFADFNRDGEVEDDDLARFTSDWLGTTLWH